MNRTHISFFGRRNTGKSSLVNALTGQNTALVSPVKGTTTDPVYKPMELLPLGPVVIIDTAGLDDIGELGELRVEKTMQILNKTDIAVLIIETTDDLKNDLEKELIETFLAKNIPFIIAINKYDLSPVPLCDKMPYENYIQVSAKTGFNIDALKEKIASLANTAPKQQLIADLINPHDLVILVIPIDNAAPKERIILPQQQVLREILDKGAIAIAAKNTELKPALEALGRPPSLVITDSQVFKEVCEIVPKDIPLSSFSILFARRKGFLETAILGAAALDNLKDFDKILICEGCTHHRQCDDIGTVKIPAMIKKYSGKELEFYFCSSSDSPQDVSNYKMIIHCGACMLNDREMIHRKNKAVSQNIPFTNYGIAIAHIQGILKRSIEIFDINVPQNG